MPSTSPSGPVPGGTLADIGEFGFLDLLATRLPQGAGVRLGPGDDAAEVDVPGGRALLCTDVLVDGRHFRRDWASAADIGHRAAAQSLSDCNAMGGRATAVTVGLAAPPDLEVAWALEMSEGIVEECGLVGASLVGGDLTRSDVLVVSVSAVGVVAGEPVRRAGARAGDVVAVCGRLGWAAGGLAVLGRGFRSPRALVEAYRRPEVPYDAGPEAHRLGATAMVDVSDGLLADLGHLAVAGGVTVDLHSDAFDVDEPLQAVGAALGADPLTFVLTGGDDHALAATFPADVALPRHWRVVGTVAAPVEGADAGGGAGAGAVTVDRAAFDAAPGFRHF